MPFTWKFDDGGFEFYLRVNCSISSKIWLTLKLAFKWERISCFIMHFMHCASNGIGKIHLYKWFDRRRYWHSLIALQFSSRRQIFHEDTEHGSYVHATSINRTKHNLPFALLPRFLSWIVYKWIALIHMAFTVPILHANKFTLPNDLCIDREREREEKKCEPKGNCLCGIAICRRNRWQICRRCVRIFSCSSVVSQFTSLNSINQL